MSVRKQRIYEAISGAAELIGELLKYGPLTPEQCGVLIAGNVQASVSNVKQFEIVTQAQAIMDDVAKAAAGIPKLKLSKRKGKAKQDADQSSNSP